MNSRAYFDIGMRLKYDGWWELSGLGRPMEFPPSYIENEGGMTKMIERVIDVHITMQQLD